MPAKHDLGRRLHAVSRQPGAYCLRAWIWECRVDAQRTLGRRELCRNAKDSSARICEETEVDEANRSDIPWTAYRHHRRPSRRLMADDLQDRKTRETCPCVPYIEERHARDRMARLDLRMRRRRNRSHQKEGSDHVRSNAEPSPIRRSMAESQARRVRPPLSIGHEYSGLGGLL